MMFQVLGKQFKFGIYFCSCVIVHTIHATLFSLDNNALYGIDQNETVMDIIHNKNSSEELTRIVMNDLSLENANINVESHPIPHVRHLESKRLRSKDVFLHDRYNGPPLLDMSLKYCQRSAKCQLLNYTTCMGSKLPYHYTSLDLTDLSSQEKVQEKLQIYQYLRYIPQCWAVIQPFLCALYMPKCDNDLVNLPSKEMCRISRGPCKILYNTTVFPNFMDCDNKQLFPSQCKNYIQEVKFNTTGLCMQPLVRTDQPEWFFPGVEGCGIQCKDVLYTKVEHQQIHKLMIYCLLFCIISNLFAIFTFVIDWKTGNKYPALAIFYINICFFISYCGWLVQFLSSETREDIVCKKDGTLRKHEPSANENLSCVSVFVMVYYFSIAGMVWFIIFTYAWYMSSLQALGKIRERVDKKRAYFHLLAWSLPLILTITTMALGEIDGDYVFGICFVGFVNPAARIGLLLTPLGLTIIVAGYIVIQGLLLLIQVKIDSRDVISVHSSRKIRSNIVRMGVFALFMALFCVITFVYHIYVFTNSRLWHKSLENYIVCKLTSLSIDFSHCNRDTRPSVAMLQLQLLAVFGSGIAAASWVWCSATFHAWIRFIRRKGNCEVSKPVKFQKHKIIAQAFEKRKKFNEGHQISFECQHTDPVGLHFDLNSAASNEVSTTWAANLPRFVHRRGAVPEVVICSASSNSEMSYSLQQISIESRRNSGESQLSVQISEVTAKINGRIHRNRGRRKRNVTRASREFIQKTCKSKIHKKRGSTTSSESVLGTQLLNMIDNTTNSKNEILPDLNKRRVANAGLVEESCNIMANAKFMLPYEKDLPSNQSDDEKMSVTISESKYSIILNNHSTSNLTLNDHLIKKSLRRDLQIKELTSSTSGITTDKRDSTEKTYYNSDSDNSNSDSSFPELKQLLHSSLNSADSTTTQNRASKQSKTSIDVAVQANAKEIASQTGALHVSDFCNIDMKEIQRQNQNKIDRKLRRIRTKQR